MIVVSGSKMVEDLRKGTEEQMSFADALADVCIPFSSIPSQE